MKKQIIGEINYGKELWDEGYMYHEHSVSIVLISHDNLFGLEIGGLEVLPIKYASINIIYTDRYSTTKWFIIEQDSKFGILKCTERGAELLLNVIYDKIEKANNFGSGNVAWGDFCGLLELTIKKYQGIFDIYKGLMVPCQYDSIIHVSNHTLFKVVKNGRVGLFSNGNEIVPVLYDDVGQLSRGYKVTLNGLHGIYINGSEKSLPIYDNITNMDGAIIIEKGGLYGILTNENTIIEPIYKKIKQLYANYYAFFESDNWGVLDNKGHIIISPKYQQIYCINITDKSDNCCFCVQIDDYWGVINTKETIIIQPIYDYITVKDGIAYARIGRRKFIINKNEETAENFIGNNTLGYEEEHSTMLAYDCSIIDLFKQ